MTVRLPRLLDSSLQETARLHPVQLSLDLRMQPLSGAEMTLPAGDALLRLHDLVELFTARGSAGIYRVAALEQDAHGLTRVSLQHGLSTLADALLPGNAEGDATAQTLLTRLLSRQSGAVRWTLGRVDYPDDETLHYEWHNANALHALLDLLRELPGYRLTFDQSASPWVLHLTALSQDPPCECRLNRNIASLSILRDDADLCTRLYVEGLDEPLDADTIDRWGVISRSMSADTDVSESLLRRSAQRYLDAHKEPQITVVIGAADLSRVTGESLDSFTPGRLCRVALPDSGCTVLQRIVSMHWPDLLSAPDQMTLTLATRAGDASDAIAGLEVDTTVLRKRTGRTLRLQAERIELLSEELLLQAQDIELQAETIQAQAERIEVLSGELVIQAQTIEVQAQTIEAQAETIALKADRIDLQGYVTANALETEVLQVLQGGSISMLTLGSATVNQTLDAGYVNCSTLSATDMSAQTLSLDGAAAAWKSASVVYSGGQVVPTISQINYVDHSGANQSKWVVTAVSFDNVYSKTIKYLGA